MIQILKVRRMRIYFSTGFEREETTHGRHSSLFEPFAQCLIALDRFSIFAMNIRGENSERVLRTTSIIWTLSILSSDRSCAKL